MSRLFFIFSLLVCFFVGCFSQPSGSVFWYGGTTAPSGYLFCNGASVSRSTYSALFSAIGTAFGTASGSTFNVPDLRGRFARGWNNGAGNDPDASTRTAINTGGATGDNVGSLQADTLISHTHALYYSFNPGAMLTGSSVAGADGGAGSYPTDPNIPGSTSAETRPKNVGFMPIIKT